MKDNTIQRVLAFFLVISAILVVVAVSAVRSISRSVDTSDWVNHTHAIILEAQELGSALNAGEAALRAYALTGDSRDQAACREAFSRAAENLEVAKALTRDEPVRRRQTAEIEALVNQRSARVREILAGRESANPEAVRRLIAADSGAEGNREIQRKLEKLKEEEMALLADRDRASYLQAQLTRWTVWLGVALDVLLLGGAGWLIRDDVAARRRAARVLEEANIQLEVRVRERTSALVTANEQLSAENMERQWSNHALEHQLRYNQLIINSISDMVFVLTKTMNISRVNPAVVRQTGLEPQELVNQPLSRVVRLASSDGARGPLFDPVVQALKDGHDLRDQPAVLEDRRGQKTPVRFTMFPLRDGDKVVGGIVTLQVAAARMETPP